MADSSHLDELAAAEGGALAKALIESFKMAIRNSAVEPSEYAAGLREVMEEAFSQRISAASESHRS